ncbi:MAG: fluoride efflux transporter CrcB [Nocardioides sp.]|uniref:fluoride efflux transporter CrcB n=1 Tax=Nocardioides sp. TaxID=35761 RepID=UPI0039E39D64
MAEGTEPAHEPTATVDGGWESEPVDPDTGDEQWPRHATRRQRREHARLLATIAAGGILGACARYGAGLRWPVAPGSFPWTTLWINVIGCGAMGILMVLVTERFAAHPLVRPFLGTGVLGGFTTFSTYTVDVQRLLQLRASGTGLSYLALTLVGAVLAVWIGATLTRAVALGPRRRRL